MNPLSTKQKALLRRFGEEDTIKQTRWVLVHSMSRAGGDPNPRTYTALQDRRLIIRLKEDISIRGGKRYSVQHYRITDKGKRVLKTL